MVQPCDSHHAGILCRSIHLNNLETRFSLAICRMMQLSHRLPIEPPPLSSWLTAHSFVAARCWQINLLPRRLCNSQVLAWGELLKQQLVEWKPLLPHLLLGKILVRKLPPMTGRHLSPYSCHGPPRQTAHPPATAGSKPRGWGCITSLVVVSMLRWYFRSLPLTWGISEHLAPDCEAGRYSSTELSKGHRSKSKVSHTPAKIKGTPNKI